MSMIFNPAQAVRRKVNNLGLLEPQMKLLRSWADDEEQKGGVVLLSAPSDNGRTTMSYSFMRLHDAYTATIQSVE